MAAQTRRKRVAENEGDGRARADDEENGDGTEPTAGNWRSAQ